MFDGVQIDFHITFFGRWLAIGFGIVPLKWVLCAGVNTGVAWLDVGPLRFLASWMKLWRGENE